MQAELERMPGAERRIAIDSEVERAMPFVKSSERVKFLEALATECPGLFADQATPPRPPLAVDAEAEDNPAALIDRLAELFKNGDARARASVTRRLADAGLCQDPGSNPSLSQIQTLIRSSLRLSDSCPVDIRQVVEVFALLANTISGLDNWVRETWNRCAQDNVNPASLLSAIHGAISAPSAQAGAAAANARRLLNESMTDSVRRIESLVSALKDLPREYAQKFAPDVILETAGAKGRGDQKSRCWDAYVELCGGSEPQKLAHEIAAFWPIILDRIKNASAPTTGASF
ncbi:MAG TPA: hypothetical protein VG326_05570 [Tepidisphaeraceae bacterium]|jgi:hypothetical protein|nr:hypothetical protein [Tepidisphaeraceae bacterium]